MFSGKHVWFSWLLRSYSPASSSAHLLHPPPSVHTGVGKPPATPRMPPWVTTQKTLSCEYICGRVGVGGCVCFVVRDNTPLPGRCVVFVTLNTSDDHLLWSAFGSLTQWRHIPHQSASSIYATVRSSSADKHIHSRTNLPTSSEQLVMCHHVTSNRPHWI